MNKNINKFSKGKIYKIIDLTTGNYYIGSTINTLNQRIREHKSSYNRYISKLSNSYFCYSYEILKNCNFMIILVKNYKCLSQNELEIEEDKYIINDLKCVNKKKAHRTTLDLNKYLQDYRIKNKEKIAKNIQEYKEKNKEKINEKRREKIPCEFCGKLGRRELKYNHLKICKKNPNNLISQVNV